jgi:hypothetical protein
MGDFYYFDQIAGVVSTPSFYELFAKRTAGG